MNIYLSEAALCTSRLEHGSQMRLDLLLSNRCRVHLVGSVSNSETSGPDVHHGQHRFATDAGGAVNLKAKVLNAPDPCVNHMAHTWIALSKTFSAIFGATTLIIAISRAAA